MEFKRANEGSQSQQLAKQSQAGLSAAAPRLEYQNRSQIWNTPGASKSEFFLELGQPPCLAKTEVSFFVPKHTGNIFSLLDPTFF